MSAVITPERWRELKRSAHLGAQLKVAAMALCEMAEQLKVAHAHHEGFDGDEKFSGTLDAQGFPLRLQLGENVAEVVVAESAFVSEFDEDRCDYSDIGIGVGGGDHRLSLSLELTAWNKA